MHIPENFSRLFKKAAQGSLLVFALFSYKAYGDVWFVNPNDEKGKVLYGIYDEKIFRVMSDFVRDHGKIAGRAFNAICEKLGGEEDLVERAKYLSLIIDEAGCRDIRAIVPLIWKSCFQG